MNEIFRNLLEIMNEDELDILLFAIRSRTRRVS